jgi:catechol 2,3-dioxygenase-like lactoylglutathione lyase family enzyme
MTAATGRASLLTCDALIGAEIPVRDHAEARPFYELLFAALPGRWQGDNDADRFAWGGQTLRFVAVAEPRVFPDGGQHLAYRIPRERLDEVIQRLSDAGHSIDWWREDHPSERTLGAYVQDPSGNRVQLVPGDPDGPLIDHVVIETHDLELAEVFWTRVLGGTIDYYHGRRSRDYTEAVAWGEGRDPCAPWTRLWPGAGLGRPQPAQRRAAHPNQQLFLRFGADRVGLVLAPRHRQEPPEEQVSGTPAVVLRTPQSVREAVAALERRDVDLRPEERLRIRWEASGNTIALRDPGGNFVRVECARG